MSINLGGPFLPSIHSLAVNAASSEGAGGKMSAWKLSACEVAQFSVQLIAHCRNDLISITDFTGNDKSDRFDGARSELESTSDLVLSDIDSVSRQEGEPSFWYNSMDLVVSFGFGLVEYSTRASVRTYEDRHSCVRSSRTARRQRIRSTCVEKKWDHREPESPD
jgi:hypothetical protein